MYEIVVCPSTTTTDQITGTCSYCTPIVQKKHVVSTSDPNGVQLWKLPAAPRGHLPNNTDVCPSTTTTNQITGTCSYYTLPLYKEKTSSAHQTPIVCNSGSYQQHPGVTCSMRWTSEEEKWLRPSLPSAETPSKTRLKKHKENSRSRDSRFLVRDRHRLSCPPCLSLVPYLMCSALRGIRSGVGDARRSTSTTRTNTARALSAALSREGLSHPKHCQSRSRRECYVREGGAENFAAVSC